MALFSATTFSMIGAASFDVLCSLFNNSGVGGPTVLVHELGIRENATTNTGTMRNYALQTLTSLPSGGTLHTPTAFNTSDTAHVSSVEFRGSATSDGTNSEITATGVDRVWSTNPIKSPSLAHQWSEGAGVESDYSPNDQGFLPLISDPIKLANGQGIVVRALVDLSSSLQFFFNATWDEVAAAGGTTSLPPARRRPRITRGVRSRATFAR
jgi:hypothetical protein